MASGSWNNDCKIWKSEKENEFKCITTLTDHSYAVQCQFLSNGLLVTGSQDGTLNLFDQTGELINRNEQAHTDIIRKIKEYRFGEVTQRTGHFNKSIIKFIIIIIIIIIISTSTIN